MGSRSSSSRLVASRGFAWFEIIIVLVYLDEDKLAFRSDSTSPTI